MIVFVSKIRLVKKGNVIYMIHELTFMFICLDIKAEEVRAGVSPAVQYEAVIETMVVDGVQNAVLARKTGDLP